LSYTPKFWSIQLPKTLINHASHTHTHTHPTHSLTHSLRCGRCGRAISDEQWIVSSCLWKLKSKSKFEVQNRKWELLYTGSLRIKHYVFVV